MSYLNTSSVREVRRAYDYRNVVTPALSFTWENVFEIITKTWWIAVLAILALTGVSVSTGVANAAPSPSHTISYDADTNSGFGSAIIGGGE